MAVNRIEPHVLTYHDEDGDTLEIHLSFATPADGLYFETYHMYLTGHNGRTTTIDVRRDAVETIVASLTAWLETGSLEIPGQQTPARSEPK